MTKMKIKYLHQIDLFIYAVVITLVGKNYNKLTTFITPYQLRKYYLHSK